ncbi:MAG: pilus assembly protein PilM [Firmicutes bacterium]|nr:pilus assembly protein PilM [Bacillota bacterium]
MGIFRRSHIGVDIGGASIKVVKLRLRSSQIQVVKAGLIETPPRAYSAGAIVDPPLLAKALGELWRKVGLGKKKPVLLALSGPRVYYRMLTMPIIPQEELKKALEWELEDYLPFSAQEAVFACLSPGNGKASETRLGKHLLIAVEKEIVAGYLKGLTLSGLEAKVLEPKPLALLRTVDQGEVVSLYVLIEYKYITFIISTPGKIPFIRVVPWEIPVRKGSPLSVTRGELLQECKSTLQYYQAHGLGDAPQRLVLYSDKEIDNCSLLKELAAGLGLPAQWAGLGKTKLTWLAEIPEEERFLFAAAIGLGLRGVVANGGY